MLTFQQFILEKSVSEQLQRVGLAVSVDMPDNLYIHDKSYNIHKIFQLFTKEEKAEPQEIPVFNYANWKIEKMIADGWNPELVYNKIEAKERVSSKADWHKIHEGSQYVPKVAYDKEGIADLKFPIIAKPDNRYSGQGIVVVKDASELEKLDLKEFAVFSEKIDIDQELRIFCWRGTPIRQLYRNPANDETKNLSKDPDDKLKFNFELEQGELRYDIADLVKEFSEAHKDLDYYSIDIAITKDGKQYVIEMSSEPGPIFGVMGEVYKNIYEDFYNEPLSPEAQAKIDEYIKQDMDQTHKSDPERFKIK